MTNTVLSVDWDFFFYRPFEDKNPPTITLPNGQKTGLAPFFDWGHTERHSPILQEILWASRFTVIKQIGQDPYQITRRGCEDPAVFADIVSKHFAAPLHNVNHSDSHRHAFYTVSDAYDDNDQEPVHVLHFDAHHDLGYSGKTVKDHTKMGVYDCADWLLAALNAGLVNHVDVVYPDWRGLYESEACASKHYKKHSVNFMTWDSWKKEEKPVPYNISAMHIARSGTWVPPWFDKEFETFLGCWPSHELTCFDCIVNIPGAHSCTPRNWTEPTLENDFPQFNAVSE